MDWQTHPNTDAIIKQLEAVTRERDELARNTCQLGTCVKCGNPAQDTTKEHFVGATASEGARTPEDSRPQRVEAPHHFSQPENMVDRIADILVEDHIALMKECEELRRELSLERKRSFRAQLEAVTQECESLRADATRYRWKRQRDMDRFPSAYNSRDAYDAAIDAVMKEAE